MKRFTVIVLVLVGVCSAMAAYTPGTVGFQFLKTQVGARPSAMGGAFLAIPGDVHAIFYNPAGIADIQQRVGSFTYMKHLLDFNSGFVGFVQPKLGPGNFGIGINYMDYGDFKKTDTDGQQLGTFSANSFALSAVYAIQPMHNFSAGATFKYIRAAIDNYSADALALDVGILYYIPSQKLSLAAGVFNVGQALSAFMETKDSLPMNLRAGLAKHLEHLPLLVSINVYRYKDETWHGAIGGEFTLHPNVLLRLGYDSVGRDIQVDSSGDRFAGGSIGLGLVWSTMRIDYAFSSLGEIGSLNRFSISSHF